MLYFGLCEPGHCILAGGVCVYVLFYMSLGGFSVCIISLGCQDVSSLGCQDVSSLGRGCICVYVLFYVSASVCMFCYNYMSLGVSSLGNNLSRCFVFRQGGSVCVCVYVLFCVSHRLEPWLSRCFVFGQQPVKMLGRGVLCAVP